MERAIRGFLAKGEDVLNKLLHAAAVLALLTGTIAVAQIGGTVGGPVGGAMDRGFSTEISGARGGGGGGGRTQSHSSTSSWAPTKNMAAAGGAEKSARGNDRAGAQEEASFGQTAN